MKIKRYNISKPEKYTVHDPERGGVEKTRWNNVGTLIEFYHEDGSIGRMVEIPAIGLKANAYPIEDREDKPAADKPVEKRQTTKPTVDTIEYPEEKIDINDIPF